MSTCKATLLVWVLGKVSPGRSPPTWNRAVKNKNFVSNRPMEYLRNQTREKRRKTDYQWELGKEVIWPWFFLVSFQYVWSYSKNRPKNLLIVDLFNVFMTFLSLTFSHGFCLRWLLQCLLFHMMYFSQG